MPRVPVLAALATLVMAVPAGAQDLPPAPTVPTVPTTPTTTTPAPAPAPAPEPVTATIGLKVEKVNGPRDAILAHQRFSVRGTVEPYVTGQTVTIRFYRGTHRLGSKTVHVRPIGGGVGRFLVGYTPRGAGKVTVRASHRATAEWETATAHSKSVTVLPSRLLPGARGSSVAAMQRLLERLHLAVRPTGDYDQRTGRAVLAFQKLTGLPRSSVADSKTLRRLLAGRGRFKVRFPKQGRHVEADLAEQVIALIGRRGKVEHVYPVSSGKPSTPTVLGTFRFYEKAPGYNSEGMYFSSYFIRGYAIHGFDPSPNFPASHGCLRTWIPDAIAIYNWIQLGETIDVYSG